MAKKTKSKTSSFDYRKGWYNYVKRLPLPNPSSDGQARRRGLMENNNKIKNRFEYWKISRGSYILSAKYIKELEEFLFTGQSETIGQGYDEKRRY